MSKEIDALRNLIAAMDAEEKARDLLERERASFFRMLPSETTAADGSIVLPASFNAASEAWAKAFSELAGARGIAKHLIRNHDAAFAEAVARRPHQVKRECSDCDGEPGSCHMNCGPAVARSK
jgi:hypothetical protein